jgi:hypothetical protein
MTSFLFQLLPPTQFHGLKAGVGMITVPQDGYPIVELDDEWISDNQRSVTSFVRKPEGMEARNMQR